MLSASSPIVFPKSSSPPAPKRTKPHDHGPPRPKPPAGPFIIEDEDSEDEVEDDGHDSKRPMLEDPRDQIPDTIPDAQIVDDADAEEALHDTAEQPDSILPSWTSSRTLFSSSVLKAFTPTSYNIQTCNGKSSTIKQRKASAAPTYESMVAARSRTKEGRAKRSYYGIDIHNLINTANTVAPSKTPSEPNQPVQSVEKPIPSRKHKPTKLWTEKYRARTFMDLCGDDGTNRLVLRWLKRWDPIVFPGAARSKPVVVRRAGRRAGQQEQEEKPHRKILMLTGPPGLGKTTLAHVCARQAGYEVMEINASDDRSRDVVKNRIRTSLGTESVKTVSNRKVGDGPQKVAKPACVVVDEVDGVVSGSGGSGEGGFVKALIDLVLLDQRNTSSATTHTRKKKGDDFRLMRPLILICNDVYHPSLRPLRQSGLAEIIHVGKPSLDAVVTRLKTIFEKEGIPCEKDAARKLCEAAWGMTSGIDAKRGAESTVEGDLRGVMVVGEWVAGRFRASKHDGPPRLTRQWLEANILRDLAAGAGAARGLGRGSVRDIVNRLFLEGGGFPKQALSFSSSSKTQHEQPKAELGFNELQKKHAMERLTQMVETSGEIAHVVAEVFAEYPRRDYNDDLYLSKPALAHEWLHFHDACHTRLYSSQEWELAPYLCQPVLACHHLFASPHRHQPPPWDDDDAAQPFSGPRADFQAREAEKLNRTQLQALQAQLPPTLMRSFRSAEDMAVEFMPWLVRLVSPDVKPVVVGGSAGATASVRREAEKKMVLRACDVLADVGVELHRGKIEETGPGRAPQYVYRMEPDLDALSTFETASSLLLSSAAPTRYAVRQVLDQELQRTHAARAAAARQVYLRSGPAQAEHDKENDAPQPTAQKAEVKRDFFGRVIQEVMPLREVNGNGGGVRAETKERKVWVTYHEGLNNAVRKPMSMQEFFRGL